MRSRACGGPVRNGALDGPLLGQQVLRQAVTGSAALHIATTLTCVDWVRRGGLTVAFSAVKGLLMRFGFAAIRGSNPRASAPHQAGCRNGNVPGFVSVIGASLAALSGLLPRGAGPHSMCDPRLCFVSAVDSLRGTGRISIAISAGSRSKIARG